MWSNPFAVFRIASASYLYSPMADRDGTARNQVQHSYIRALSFQEQFSYYDNKAIPWTLKRAASELLLTSVLRGEGREGIAAPSC
jgi:hypothetical protein